MSGDVVLTVLQDKRKQYWFGTDTGLTYLRNNQFHPITMKDGLPNNTIYKIIEDNHQNLWFSSVQGIFSMPPGMVDQYIENRERYHLAPDLYTKDDGMIANECNGGSQAAGCITTNGQIWFPTMKGLAVIDTGKRDQNRILPPIRIEQIVVDNQILPFQSHLVLPAGTRKIEFHYAALSYLAPQKNRYKYRLENFETDWEFAGSRQIAYYTNVSPGSYRFQVKGCNNDGLWNEEGSALTFYLTPHFYETPLFIGLAGFIGLAVVFLGFRLRVRQLRRRKIVLEKLVRERTEQLSQSHLDLVAANIELQKLSIVARETEDAVIIMNADFDIEWINTGYTRMYGMTLPQLIRDRGGNYRQIGFNDNSEIYLQDCVRNKKAVQFMTQLTKDSGLKWIKTTLTPILGPSGNVEKLVAIDSDFTQIKEAENRAQKASRSKSEFLARMSHEIRTPMNGIIGFTNMLNETKLTEEQQDYVRTINSCGDSLIILLNDILDFSKIEAGELTFNPSDVNLETLLYEACQLTLTRIDKKPVDLLCHIKPDIPDYIFADGGRIKQVVINLLGNATKFTDEGEIELSVRIDKQKREMLKFHISIRDTGIGIADEHLESIFDIFQQADNSTTRKYGGTGLGLAICRQIARLMAGDVWVESEVGIGSVFHFTGWVGHSEKSSPLPDYCFEGKKILIIDRNRRHREILAESLRDQGMSVATRAEIDEVDIADCDIVLVDIPLLIELADPQLSQFNRQVLISMAYPRSTGNRSPDLLAIRSTLSKPIPRRKLFDAIDAALDHPQKNPEAVSQRHFPDQKETGTTECNARILLAEDNPINLKLAKFMLERAGYCLTTVENGAAAVKTFCNTPDHFDLILMDIQMPEMDGREATRRIREAGYQEVPIVAMTASAMKGDKQKCLAAGMNDYIAKPINKEIVLNVVQRWCRTANPKPE